MILRFENVRLALAEFDLTLDGEYEFDLMAILGPSGSGKTSLLEIIAGLRHPQEGKVTLGGMILSDAATRHWIPTHRRQIGYVPQDLALFPHLTVRANLEYGMRPTKSREKFDGVCEVLEIDPLLSRFPADISGGQKQRVAFARAVLADPRLLLLDEPLSNLDQELKERIFPYLKRIRDDFKIPILYVTHSRQEASLLADAVVHLRRGSLRE